MSDDSVPQNTLREAFKTWHYIYVGYLCILYYANSSKQKSSTLEDWFDFKEIYHQEEQPGPDFNDGKWENVEITLKFIF